MLNMTLAKHWKHVCRNILRPFKISKHFFTYRFIDGVLLINNTNLGDYINII